MSVKLCVRSGLVLHDNSGEMSSWPAQLLYRLGIVSPAKLLLFNFQGRYGGVAGGVVASDLRRNEDR